MAEAVLTIIMTLAVGYVGTVVGHEFMGAFQEFGLLCAVAAAAGMIVFFSKQKRS